MYYDRKGNPISTNDFVKLKRGLTYSIVQQTVFPNGKFLSTVWLGLDHNFGTGPIKIFETMLFESKKQMMELECWRYSTEQEAIEGHNRLLRYYEVETGRKRTRFEKILEEEDGD